MATFLDTANDYLAIQRSAAATIKHSRWLLERLTPVHPVDVEELAAPGLLAALRGIESQGQEATAHRACAFAGSVLRYALAAGLRRAPDFTASLKRALVAAQVTNRAAITDPKKFGHLLVAIDGLAGGPVRDALRVLPHLFVRPTELRGMQWPELDLEAGEWRIPACRMKMRKPFVKFLSAAACNLLAEIRARDRADLSAFVFPGRERGSISENIMGQALERLFYSSEEMTPHGFRASASTMLHEAGHDHAVIEAALAHSPKDGTTYNRSVLETQQRELHAAWSGMILEMKGLAR